MRDEKTLHGSKVRLLRALVTRGGVWFVRGEVVTLRRLGRGCGIEADDGRRLDGVNREDFEVLADMTPE